MVLLELLDLLQRKGQPEEILASRLPPLLHGLRDLLPVTLDQLALAPDQLVGDRVDRILAARISLTDALFLRLLHIQGPKVPQAQRSACLDLFGVVGLGLSVGEVAQFLVDQAQLLDADVFALSSCLGDLAYDVLGYLLEAQRVSLGRWQFGEVDAQLFSVVSLDRPHTGFHDPGEYALVDPLDDEVAGKLPLQGSEVSTDVGGNPLFGRRTNDVGDLFARFEFRPIPLELGTVAVLVDPARFASILRATPCRP
ncbi:hypothetical protein [Nocardia cyriacigeorgica]|uniref:hypothetical protein n=1 Tax=Nocardia cyriacigeorgica TaxID=135487 RepID=UPI0024575BD7|nr:hypothetical protein [Nocardia cyriacigeorgica]